MISSKTALGIALLAAASASHALSLGSPRGGAVIGQPLQLGFDLTLDGPSDGSSACAQAELYYGETRVEPSRVQIATFPGAQPTQIRIQLASSIAVNEPVVSVMLRAGCGQGMSRRYVLLASSPTAQAEPLPGAVLPERAPDTARRGAVGASLPPLSGDTGAAPSAGAMAGTPAAPSRAAAVPRAAPPARAAATPKPAPSTNRAAAATPDKRVAPGTPRLELQSPTDWLEEHSLPLRPSLDMGAPAAAVTPQQRAAAAAAWRRLFAEASPEIAAAAEGDQAQSLRSLEEQVKNLQAGMNRNQGREAEMQARLDQAEQERNFYLWGAVAALVLLVAGTVLFLLGRSRGRDADGTAWWRPRQPAGGTPLAPSFQEPVADPVYADAPLPSPVAHVPEPEPVAVPHHQPSSASADHTRQIPQPFAPRAHTADAAVAAVELPSEPVAPVASLSSSAAAATAAAHELRALDTDALLDVQQNAEFYVSLGQYEQAIELLQGYIAAHPGVNPAVYLDLLKILHTLSLTDAYRKLREEFNASFNADVPVFAGFLKSQRRLEAYPEALARIEAHWERDDVLDVVEEYLFKQTGGHSAAPFELEAYRELLLLHAVARISIHQDPASRQGAAVAAVAAVGTRSAVTGVAAVPASPAVFQEPFVMAAGEQQPESVHDRGSEATPTHASQRGEEEYRPSFPLDALNQRPVDDSGLQPLSFELAPDDLPKRPANAPPPGFGPVPPSDDNLIDFDLLDIEALQKGKKPHSNG